MFPLLPFLPIAVIACAKAAKELTGTAFFERRWVKKTLGFCVVLNLGLLASVMIRPAATEMLPAYFVYKNYPLAPTIYSDRKLVYNYGLLTIDFYQRPATILIDGRPGPCPSDAPCLYSANTHDVDPPKGSKLVYTNQPQWLKIINYGGWQDNMKWWYIYEIEK